MLVLVAGYDNSPGAGAGDCVHLTRLVSVATHPFLITVKLHLGGVLLHLIDTATHVEGTLWEGI
jgi:hypothetical protein